jgi:hypothetical protein
MTDQMLDLSNVINVSIMTAASGLGIPNINTAALFTVETKPEAWGSNTYAIYKNASEVLTDWGVSSPVYKIATSFFAQQPNVLTTNGYLAVVPLISSEKVETAIARVLNSVYFFGVLVDAILYDEYWVEADLVALSTYMETVDKILFYASRTPADYAPGGMLDDLRTASKSHTRGLYYYTATAIDTQKFAAAYAGRALSTDFAGVNTAQTLHLKSLVGVTPDQTITQTELVAAGTAGVDVYCSIAGVSSLFTSGENRYFDQVYNSLWLKRALEVAGFNYIRQTSTKIPQTEEGVEGLKAVVRAVCSQAVRNGFLGRGSWTSSTVFGNPADLIRNISDYGFYVYSLPVAQQLQADREDRKAPLIQIAAKESGAIHSATIQVNINQ